jgi:acyl-CoA thioesterase-1
MSCRNVIVAAAISLAGVVANCRAEEPASKPTPSAAAETKSPGGASKSRPTHPAQVQVEEDSTLPRVLLIGDSISMGYTLPLRQELANVANVLHPSENCRSSRHIVARIDKYLGAKPWDVILLNCGIHDVTRFDSAGATANARDGGNVQVSLEEYRANLEKIIARLKQGRVVVIWCTTTPISKSAQFRLAGDIDHYNNAAKAVMQRHGIQVIDLYQKAQKRGASKWTADGVHFTADGYRELAKDIAPVIAKTLDKARTSDSR